MTVRPQRPSKHRRWGTFAVVAAFLAAGTWWLQAPDLPLPGDTPAHFDQLLSDAPPAAAQYTVVGNALAAVPADPPSEGMTDDQWNTLKESLKNHPQRDAEIARVSAYMAFLSRLERYRALRASGAGELPLAQQLARSLLDQLPIRVARGEVANAEARLLQSALLETLYPDPAARSAQASAEQRRIQDARPPEPDVSVLAARDARYKRQEAALLAAWNARPAAERRPRELESSLESLRRSVFDNPGSAAANPSAGGSR